jgi:heme/copper-type cytochrome/quinol oxidase subunit 2
MNEIASAADHASQQSDRWMFIVMLIIVMVIGVVVWRWIVADREKLSNRLTEVTDKHIQSTEKLAEVVTNNTNALREVKDVMHMCRTKIQQ